MFFASNQSPSHVNEMDEMREYRTSRRESKRVIPTRLVPAKVGSRNPFLPFPRRRESAGNACVPWFRMVAPFPVSGLPTSRRARDAGAIPPRKCANISFRNLRMCDKHQFFFEFDKAFTQQLIEKFEASPAHSLSGDVAPPDERCVCSVLEAPNCLCREGTGHHAEA